MIRVPTFKLRLNDAKEGLIDQEMKFYQTTNFKQCMENLKIRNSLSVFV